MTPQITILYVDDHEFLLGQWGAILTRAGYKVECVARGVDAINTCKEVLFDLYLVDYQMPEMNGLEVAAKIRLINQHAKIVIFSSDVTDEPEHMFNKAISTGLINATISKLSNEAQILTEISKAITQQSEKEGQRE